MSSVMNDDLVTESFVYTISNLLGVSTASQEDTIRALIQLDLIDSVNLRNLLEGEDEECS